MRGVLMKIIREIWLGTALFSAAFLAIEILLNLVLPQILGQTGSLLDTLPFLRDLLGGLLGIEMEGEFTAELMQAFVWVHPVVLALLWANVIILCTRFPAAEIDRGTIDVLLGLPVSRRAVYCGETIGWLASGLVMLACGAVGYFIGSQAMGAEARPPLGRVLLVMMNLYGIYLAVGGVTCLVSSLSDRRGRAVAIVFGLVVASFLLTFLARFWAPAEHVVFLSVLDYYQPASILRSGAVAWSDVTILLMVASAGWLIGLEVTARRSICTT